MSKLPEPRRLIFEGNEVVVLPAADYEMLLATRRQLGAQNERIRILRQRLSQLRALLGETAEALSALGDDADEASLARLDMLRVRCEEATSEYGS